MLTQRSNLVLGSNPSKWTYPGELTWQGSVGREVFPVGRRGPRLTLTIFTWNTNILTMQQMSGVLRRPLGLLALWRGLLPPAQCGVLRTYGLGSHVSDNDPEVRNYNTRQHAVGYMLGMGNLILTVPGPPSEPQTNLNGHGVSVPPAFQCRPWIRLKNVI